MTDSQENKLSMNRATETVLNNNNSIWSANTLFDTVKTAFSDKIADLVNARQRQLEINTGIAVDKKVLKNLLITQAGSIGAKLVIFAEDTNNNELLDEVNLSHSKLDKSRDEVVAGLCQNIHDHADDNIALLAPYGITAGMLTTFQSAITLYSAKAPQPRVAAAAKKAVTAQIVTLTKDIDKVLKNRLDKLMEDYKTSEAEFYNAYKAARIIINLGATHTRLQTHVKDQNGDPLKLAIVFLLQNNLVRYAGKSNDKGNVLLSKVKPGTYDLKVSKDGYTSKTETGILFKAGKQTSRIVSLTPGSSNPANGTAVRQGDLAMGAMANISLMGINGTPQTTITIEAKDSPVRLYASPTIDGLPGAVFFDVTENTTAVKLGSDLATQIGLDDTNKFLMVQNTGTVTGHYTFTFNNLEV